MIDCRRSVSLSRARKDHASGSGGGRSHRSSRPIDHRSLNSARTGRLRRRDCLARSKTERTSAMVREAPPPGRVTHQTSCNGTSQRRLCARSVRRRYSSTVACDQGRMDGGNGVGAFHGRGDGRIASSVARSQVDGTPRMNVTSPSIGATTAPVFLPSSSAWMAISRRFVVGSRAEARHDRDGVAEGDRAVRTPVARS